MHLEIWRVRFGFQLRSPLSLSRIQSICLQKLFKMQILISLDWKWYLEVLCKKSIPWGTWKSIPNLVLQNYWRCWLYKFTSWRTNLCCYFKYGCPAWSWTTLLFALSLFPFFLSLSGYIHGISHTLPKPLPPKLDSRPCWLLTTIGSIILSIVLGERFLCNAGQIIEETLTCYYFLGNHCYKLMFLVANIVNLFLHENLKDNMDFCR